MCGSYADMSAGLPSEACKDFCGGVNMIYELRDAHTTGQGDKLWLTLERATASHAMICCGTAWKGVNGRTLRSPAKRRDPLTFPCFVFGSGHAAEHCIAHRAGGRPCLHHNRGHQGNDHNLFIIYDKHLCVCEEPDYRISYIFAFKICGGLSL